MRLLLVTLLLAIPFAASPAEAWYPVCHMYDTGEEGGKVSAEVWLTCGTRAEVTTCPKDGFCRTFSTEDDLP